MKELFYYKRETGTNIKDYISEFEARVQRAIAKKVPKFPDELLMWLLLEGSNISEIGSDRGKLHKQNDDFPRHKE